MAYTSGAMTAAAGQLVGILDANLVLNACWTLYDDTPTANEHVYECDDGTHVFYVYVLDNQADYATIELWEGWNAGGHAGTGQSLTVSPGIAETLRIKKTIGGYGLAYNDNRFQFLNFGLYAHYYLGQFTRFDMTKNMPCFIGHTSGVAAGATKNPMGWYCATSGVWAVLFDHAGNVAKIYPTGSVVTDYYIKAHDGTCIVQETPIYQTTTTNLLGILDGAMHLATQASSLANGDTVTVGGVPWVLCGYGSVYSLCEEA